MMRSPRVLCMTLALLVVPDVFSFVPSQARRPFVGRTRPNMLSTRSHDEWELPEEVPHSKDKATSWEEQELSGPRRERLRKEASLKSKFVTGNDLYHLRQYAMSLREELQQARKLQAKRRVQELERTILKVQQVDAEFVYSVNRECMQTAQQEGRMEDYERYHEAAMEARSALPQYNLNGLWVGKYGHNCYEMINITYDGDTLLAYKVTGHSTVPSGEISFQADLSPFSTSQALDPIQLGEPAAKQWGTKYLPRFAGYGQVASEGFTNPQFVDGQLIMVNEYFSFAWIPLGHQVFFGRPSAELTLKMLKEKDKPQSETEQSRAHLARCMEETVLLEEEAMEDGDSEYFYSTNQQDYYNQEGCFE